MRWFAGSTMAALVFGLTFWSGSARADDAPASIQFDPALREYPSESVSGPTPMGYDKAVVANTCLPTKTVWVRLQAGESANDITVQTNSVESLGATGVSGDGGAVSTSSDFPYEAYVVSAEQDARVGRDAAMIDEVTFAGNRFARIQLFPLWIDDNNEWDFTESLNIFVGARLVTPDELLTREDFDRLKTTRQRLHASGGGGPQYVIMTDSTLKPAFDRLARYKSATGISTAVVLIDDAIAGYVGVDNAERLREYLKQFYADGGYYVLLGGDETVLPVRYAYHRATSTPPTAYDLQICDLYFADLTGKWDCDGDGVYGEPRDDSADVTPELAVGRLPFSTLAEADHYVDKLIAYETNPGNGDFSYLTRAFFFAADQLRDYGSGGQHGIIAGVLPDNFAIDTTTGVEAPSGLDPAPSNIEPKFTLDTLANGFGIVNINVHGRTDGFATKTSEYNLFPKSYVISGGTGSNGDLDSLPANNKVGLWYTVACDMGGFDMDEPPFEYPNENVVERALSVPGAGAVAFVAYSRWGWVSTSYLLQAAMYESLVAHPDRPAVEAMYASKDKYYYYRDLVYGQNFYGDPSLRIYLNKPQPLALHITKDGTPTVTVTSTGQPVAGIEVTVSDTIGVIGMLFTDQNGQATVDYPLENLMTYYFGCRATGTTSAFAELAPSIVTDVDDGDGSIPSGYELAQNYPNPFNPTTTISFTLKRASRAELTIYSILGQRVSTIVNGLLPAGQHDLEWDSRDDSGRRLPSGIYVYRLRAAGYTAAKKMLLVK